MKSLLVHTALVSLAVLSPLAAAPTKEAKLKAKPAFWEDPGNISARDLTWGIGGRAKAPIEGPFTFVKEDLDGNSPKLVVRDGTGAQWKVKLGAEAKPETVFEALKNARTPVFRIIRCVNGTARYG